MKTKRGMFLFLTGLFCTLAVPMFFPGIKILFLAPFIIFLIYNVSMLAALWGSLLSGCLLDILSFQSRFGLYALSFCLTTAFLYSKQRHFFADSISTLPIMTFFYSFIGGCLYFLLLNFFEGGMLFSFSSLATDLIFPAICDALFALAISRYFIIRASI